MNSNGFKLNVNGNSGGTNFQAEITDTNAAGKALKVIGGVLLEKQTGQSSSVLKDDGGTSLTPSE